MKNAADGNLRNQNQLNCGLDLIQEVDPNEEKTVKNSDKLGSQVSDIFFSKLSKSGDREGDEGNKRIYAHLQAYRQENTLKQVDSEIELTGQQITFDHPHKSFRRLSQEEYDNINDKSIDQQELQILQNDSDSQAKYEGNAADNQFSDKQDDANEVQEKIIVDEEQINNDESEQSSNTYQYIYEDENSSDSLIDEKVIEFRQTQANDEQEEDNEEDGQRIISATLFLKGKSKELQSATIRKVEEEDIEDDEESEDGKNPYRKRNNYFRVNPEIIQLPSNSFAKKQDFARGIEKLESGQKSRKSLASDSQKETPQLNPQMQEESKVMEALDLSSSQTGVGVSCIQRQFSFKSSSQNVIMSDVRSIQQEEDNQHQQNDQSDCIDENEKENHKFIIRKLNSKGDMGDKNELMSEGSMGMYEDNSNKKPRTYKIGSMNIFSSSGGGIGLSDDQNDNNNTDNSPIQHKTENMGCEYITVDRSNKDRVRSEEKTNSPFGSNGYHSNQQISSSLHTSGFPFPKNGRGIIHSYRNPLDITEREQQILKSKKIQQQQRNNILNIQYNHELPQEMSQTSIEQGEKLNQCVSIHSVGNADHIVSGMSSMNNSSSNNNSTQNANNLNPLSYKKRNINNAQQQSILQSPQPSSSSINTTALLGHQDNSQTEIHHQYYSSDHVIQNTITGSSNNIMRQGSNQSINSGRKMSTVTNSANNKVKQQSDDTVSQATPNQQQLQKQFSGIAPEYITNGRTPVNFSESPSIRPRLCQTQHIQENFKKVQGVKGNIFQSSIQSYQNYSTSEPNTQQIQSKSGLQSVQLSTQTTTNMNTSNNSHIYNSSYNNGFSTNTNPSPAINNANPFSTNTNFNHVNLNSISNSQNTVLSNYNRQQLHPKSVQINGNVLKQKQQQFTNVQSQQTNRATTQQIGQQIKVSSLNSSLVRKVNKRRIASPNTNIFSRQNPNFIVHQIHNQSVQNPHSNYNQINNKGSNNMSPNNQKSFNQQRVHGYSLSQQSTITNSNQKSSNKASICNSNNNNNNISNNSGSATSTSQYNNNNNNNFNNQLQPLQIFNNISSIHQPSILLMGASNTLTPSNLSNNNTNNNNQQNILGKVIPPSKEGSIYISNQQQIHQNQNAYIKINSNNLTLHPNQTIFTTQSQQQPHQNTQHSISPKLHQRSTSRSKSQLYTQQVQDNNSIDNTTLPHPSFISNNQTNNIHASSTFGGVQDAAALDVYGSFYYKTLNKSSVIYSPKRYSIDYPNVQSSTSSSSNTRQIVKDILKRQLNNSNNGNNTKINEKLKKTTQIYLGNNTTSIYTAISNSQNQNGMNNSILTQSGNQNNNKANAQSTYMNDSLIGIGYSNQMLNSNNQYHSNQNQMLISNGQSQNQQLLSSNGFSSQITASSNIGGNSGMHHYNQQSNMTNSRINRNGNNEETQYTLKTLPSAISLADCKQAQSQIQNPSYIAHHSQQYHQGGNNTNMCNSTRPNRKSNYTKANSLNQRARGSQFNRNSSLFENSHGSQAYISTLSVSNNYAILNNSNQQQNNNSYNIKNNLNTLKLDNNSKSTLKKYIRASSELRKRPIRQGTQITKTNNSNNNSYIMNNSQNHNQSAWLSVNGTAATTTNINNYHDHQKNSAGGQLNSQSNSQSNHLYSNSSSDVLQNNQNKVSKSIQESPQKKSVIKLLYERINSQTDEIAFDTSQ